MFFHLLIWIVSSLIEISYSFKTPKHDSVFYYKTLNNVFLATPKRNTSYGIYVAGQTITVDIPKSVVAVSDIFDWKVVNLNKDRLMFVHKKRPQILINRKTIKKMKYSGELSDSIIPFGDNEALHVPTISNPNLTKPVSNWNYIELLYFDDQSEKVSVIRSLPWLKHDDWKYIKEWKMMDYIHFDDKLYLAIKRSIRNEKTSNVTQEISIIRMCLDKGSELISSAVDIHFTRPEFNTNQINDAIFVFIFGTLFKESHELELHTTQVQSPGNTKIYNIYAMSDIIALFEQTANECAFSSGNITLLRHHLRSEIGKCKKTSYKSCSTRQNIFPSRNVSRFLVAQTISFTYKFNSLATVFHKLLLVTLPYPYISARVVMLTKPIYNTSLCEFTPTTRECSDFITKLDNSLDFAQANLHVNKNPYAFLVVTKKPNIYSLLIDICPNLKNCAQCIMYGLYFDCIWSNSICSRGDQPKNKTALTVDHCFKVIDISPLIFNSASPNKLMIQLDKPLVKTSQEYLVVQAGYNRCTNITMSGPFINCSMLLTKSGEFKIDVSLRNDKYADTASIRALSTDNVNISAPETELDNLSLFVIFGLLVSSFLLLTYLNYDKKYMDDFLELARSTKIMQIASKYIKSKDSSPSIHNPPSIKKSTSKLNLNIQQEIAAKSIKSTKSSLSMESLPLTKKSTSKFTVNKQTETASKKSSLSMKSLPSKKKSTSKTTVTNQSKSKIKKSKSSSLPAESSTLVMRSASVTALPKPPK